MRVRVTLEKEEKEEKEKGAKDIGHRDQVNLMRHRNKGSNWELTQ